MGTAAKPTRENRTITVDFRDEATYFRLMEDGKAFGRMCARLPPRPSASNSNTRRPVMGEGA